MWIHISFCDSQLDVYDVAAFVMAAQFDKVKAVDIRTAESARNTAFKEQLMAKDVKGKEK